MARRKGFDPNHSSYYNSNVFLFFVCFVVTIHCPTFQSVLFILRMRSIFWKPLTPGHMWLNISLIKVLSMIREGTEICVLVVCTCLKSLVICSNSRLSLDILPKEETETFHTGMALVDNVLYSYLVLWWDTVTRFSRNNYYWRHLNNIIALRRVGFSNDYVERWIGFSQQRIEEPWLHPLSCGRVGGSNSSSSCERRFRITSK